MNLHKSPEETLEQYEDRLRTLGDGLILALIKWTLCACGFVLVVAITAGLVKAML